MEYCNGGTLWEYLQKMKRENVFLPESEIIAIFLDILKGIQYIQWFFKQKGSNFIHGNMNLDNIFFHNTSDGKKIVKIGGFSFGKSYYSGRGVINYEPPETNKGASTSPKVDIWYLGLILYYMCFLRYPFPVRMTNIDAWSYQENFFKGRQLEFNEGKRDISMKIGHLLRRMIRFEENERIGFEEVFEHEFFEKELEKNKKNMKNYCFDRKKTQANLFKIEKTGNSNKKRSMSLIKLEDNSNKFYDFLINVQKNCLNFEKE